jgi:hypothetical protein
VPTGQNGGGGDQMGRRIFRSLFAILIFDVGGYYVMRLYRMFIAPNLSPVSAWFGTMIFGIPLNLSAASNAPILYFTRFAILFDYFYCDIFAARNIAVHFGVNSACWEKCWE